MARAAQKAGPDRSFVPRLKLKGSERKPHLELGVGDRPPPSRVQTLAGSPLHLIEMPPSTGMTTPLTYAPAREAR
jgi:hypothetical protein